MSKYRYRWPASGLTEADMALLHQVREGSEVRRPISWLIAEAVRRCYGESVAGCAVHERRDADEGSQVY